MPYLKELVYLVLKDVPFMCEFVAFTAIYIKAISVRVAGATTRMSNKDWGWRGGEGG